MVKVKRVYEARSAAAGDGKRILVDRMWPRGLRKEEVAVDGWIKEIAPSSELRKWFGHDPAKWDEFKKRYRQELTGKGEIVNKLRADAEHGTLTILYAAKDREHNNAVALKELIE